jgi:hypothetical protein
MLHCSKMEAPLILREPLAAKMHGYQRISHRAAQIGHLGA